MTATREEILAAAMATSDRLNAEDLISGPMTVTIKDVRVIQGDKGQTKLIFDIHEHEHPWHTCKSVTRTILSMWLDEPTEWIGRQLVLYRDPDVVFKNDPLGGIRISSASNLLEAFKITLTEHQKKRITRTVMPLTSAATNQPQPKNEDPFLTTWRAKIKGLPRESMPLAKRIAAAYSAADGVGLDAVVEEVRALTDEQTREVLMQFAEAVFSQWELLRYT
jgi:hypothetical protein